MQIKQYSQAISFEYYFLLLIKSCLRRFLTIFKKRRLISEFVTPEPITINNYFSYIDCVDGLFVKAVTTPFLSCRSLRCSSFFKQLWVQTPHETKLLFLVWVFFVSVLLMFLKTRTHDVLLCQMMCKTLNITLRQSIGDENEILKPFISNYRRYFGEIIFGWYLALENIMSCLNLFHNFKADCVLYYLSMLVIQKNSRPELRLLQEHT